MCPWPRIQGALLDETRMVVTYERWRGEPRGKHKKGESWRRPRRLHRLQAVRRGLPDGHRHPRRLPARMHRLRPVHRRLRRGHGQDRPAAEPDRLRQRAQPGAARRRQPPAYRLVRPRTLLYAAVLAAVGLGHAGGRWPALDRRVNVLPDRNPLFVTLSDGSIRNGYTIRVMNKSTRPKAFELAVAGHAGPAQRAGGEDGPRRRCSAAAPPTASATYRVFLHLPREAVTREQSDLTFDADATPTAARVRTLRHRLPGPEVMSAPTAAARRGARLLDPVGVRRCSSSWSSPSTA